MTARRRKALWHRKAIRRGYRILSLANTLSVMLTLNPALIAKHILRKKVLNRVSRIGR